MEQPRAVTPPLQARIVQLRLLNPALIRLRMDGAIFGNRWN